MCNARRIQSTDSKLIFTTKKKYLKSQSSADLHQAIPILQCHFKFHNFNKVKKKNVAGFQETLFFSKNPLEILKYQMSSIMWIWWL